MQLTAFYAVAYANYAVEAASALPSELVNSTAAFNVAFNHSSLHRCGSDCSQPAMLPNKTVAGKLPADAE